MFLASEKRVPLAEAFDSICGRYLLTYHPLVDQPNTIHLVSVELSASGKARYGDARLLVRGGYVVGEEGEVPRHSDAKGPKVISLLHRRRTLSPQRAKRGVPRGLRWRGRQRKVPGLYRKRSGRVELPQHAESRGRSVFDRAT
jgi:hypothetical protein